MEVYIIEMSFRQERIRETVKLEEKVDKSGRSYDIYNHGFYLSKTHQKQV